MKTIVVLVIIYISALCARAQPTIQPPNALTCLQVNYTYLNDGNGNQWSSMGKYWMNSQFGDNKSFYTESNQPLTLMRLSYGGGFGSNSENYVIQPKQQSCTVTSADGIASIYGPIVVWGIYMGTETVNGINCNKWFALGFNRNKFTLWTTVDPVLGYHMPVRYISFDSKRNTPKQTLQMDFLTTCLPQTPPDSVFALPDYCPASPVASYQ